MIRKLGAMALATVVCLVLFLGALGWTFVDFTEGSGGGGLAFDEDYLVGFLVYFENIGGGTGAPQYVANSPAKPMWFEVNPWPSDDIFDENALQFYHRYVKTEGYTYGELVQNSHFADAYTHITNSGAAPNGKLEVSATLYYTYELIGAYLCLRSIYQKSDFTYYAGDFFSMYNLNSYGSISALSHEQNISASRTNFAGTKEEITYDGKFTLELQLIDHLVGAKIIEFDAAHNKILERQIDLDSAEDFVTYAPSASCDYIFVEEEYEVMHDGAEGRKAKGDRYVERTLLSKSAENKYVYLKCPEGNGLVNMLTVSIKFAR